MRNNRCLYFLQKWRLKVYPLRSRNALDSQQTTTIIMHKFQRMKKILRTYHHTGSCIYSLLISYTPHLALSAQEAKSKLVSSFEIVPVRLICEASAETVLRRSIPRAGARIGLYVDLIRPTNAAARERDRGYNLYHVHIISVSSLLI